MKISKTVLSAVVVAIGLSTSQSSCSKKIEKVSKTPAPSENVTPDCTTNSGGNCPACGMG